MAQASRPSSSTIGLSDDPMENASDWFQRNQKVITMALGAVAVVALLIVGFRYMDRSTNAQAAEALARAQGAAQTGAPASAIPALEGVVKKYGKTSAGQQAALLLAQVRYEGKQYAEGVKGLEEAKGSASDDFTASFEQLIAMGYEAQGKHDVAADHYGKAASAAKFAPDKALHQASQALALMHAGKADEAKALWQQLADAEDPRFGQEAHVRLGEIAGASAGK